MNRPRSSRQHYDLFRRDYAQGTLDDKPAGTETLPATARPKATRRDYARDYFRWWPERWAVGSIFALAIATAGLEMIEPL